MSQRRRSRGKTRKKPSFIRRLTQILLVIALAPFVLAAIVGILMGIFGAVTKVTSESGTPNPGISTTKSEEALRGASKDSKVLDLQSTTSSTRDEGPHQESESLDGQEGVRIHREMIVDLPTESRVWKSTDGREVLGTITEWNSENQTVDLRRADGEVFEGVPIERFSPEDHAFLFGK